jgi:4-amino-4-deoxy-L-arabinose transferase-like glycosyltransferase
MDHLAVLVLSVTSLVALATFRDYGLGWDDYTHAQMGEHLLSLYGSGFRDTQALSFVNLYMYGGGFDMVAALVAKVLPITLFEARRLVGAVIGIIGLFVVWRIGRRAGGPAAGLIAVLLLAACPLYYGHMFINSKDAPFAVAMAILLLGLMRLLEEFPRATPATVLLFGAGLGLTVGTRVMGVIAGIYAAAALLFLIIHYLKANGLRPTLVQTGRFTLALLPGFAFAYLLMGLLWPWSVISPLNPLKAAEYFSVFFEKPWREVFEGRLISVPDMPPSYLPVQFGMQLPEILLLLALAGVALAGWRILKNSTLPSQRAMLILLVTSLAFPVVLAMLTRPAMYNGARHFVFLLPSMAVLGGLAGAWLFERAARFGKPAVYGAAAVVAVALASPVVEMIRLHPYEYTHYNRIEGGVRAAENRYMLDYWGLSFKQAAQQLRAKLVQRLETPPHGRKWKIAVCGPHPPAAVELGPEFELTWDSNGADFALMLGVYYCMEMRAPVLAEVAREGVTYARAYDIRERSVSSILTTQPPQ